LIRRKKKAILIIGAGPNQLPAIELARSKDLLVAVTDMDPQAEGFSLADEAGQVSTRDVAGTLAYARELNSKMPLAGVMTMASESSVTVASVAEALGLPGVSVKAAWNATNKVKRQILFHENRVAAPAFAAASSMEEALQKAEVIGYPLVIKPVDSAGSRGVRKIESPVALSDAIDEVRRVSKSLEFLLEEYVTGSEHSIEGVVIKGEIFWSGFSDRNYDKKEAYLPYFLEDGDTLPTLLSNETQQKVRDVAAQAVRALGIDWGPVKGDIIISERGPLVLEMAARLSGDYFCYETVPLHNGCNLLEVVMDLALGEKIASERLEAKFRRGVALRYVWPKPGTVRAVSGIEEVKSMPGVHFFRFEPRWRDLGIGTDIIAPRSMGERIASVMTFAETRDEALRIAEKAVSMVKIETV